MKTNKVFSILITLSLVIFLSSNGISNPAMKSTGDILKKTESKIKSDGKDKVEAISDDAENDYSYLRFNVNEYTTESTAEELPVNSFDYLRFDVNNYIDANASEIAELPAKSEFESLRFDVNNFVESYTADLDELPVNEFDYLRFDVNHFTSASNNAIEELPLTE